jgi:hypothetical protein
VRHPNTTFARRARRATQVLPILIALTLGLIAAPAHATLRGRYLQIINHSRTSHGLRPVKLNIRLSYTAQQHSRAMIRKGRLFDFSNLGTILSSYSGYRTWGGDVVGCGARLYSMHRAMMRHAIHRAIILNRNARNVGIGVIRVVGRSGCGTDMVWATAIFYG